MFYFGELAAGFGAGLTGVGRFYLAHRGAEGVAVCADVGADLADDGVEGGAAEQEVGGGEAELGTVEHAADMFGMLLLSALNDAHGCIVADRVAVQTILRTIIDLIL